MRAIQRNVAVLLLVLAISVAGGWVGSRLAQPASTGHADFHAAVLRSIELSDTQREALDALEVRHVAEQDELRRAVRAETAALAKVLERKSAYDAEVSAAVATNHRAMGALQELTLRQLFEMRAVLDADQQQVFDRLVASTLRNPPD